MSKATSGAPEGTSAAFSLIATIAFVPGALPSSHRIDTTIVFATAIQQKAAFRGMTAERLRQDETVRLRRDHKFTFYDDNELVGVLRK